jgi:hypothetical protein
LASKEKGQRSRAASRSSLPGPNRRHPEPSPRLLKVDVRSDDAAGLEFLKVGCLQV